MTAAEIAYFCEKRQVEIFTRYDPTHDSIIIKMKKGKSETIVAMERGLAAFKGFSLSAHHILKQMADQLEE